MDADLSMILAEATVAASAALLLVLALRRPVRAALGATAAYALWLCVPAALLAVSLPRGADAPLALPMAWQIMPAVQVTTATAPQQALDWPAWLLAAWLAGALASAVLLAWQQQRFRRGLGRLQRRGDGLYQSVTATAGLPAVSGVIRPRIVLPADFEQRYSTQEQALVLQHERVHVRRGDLLANALAALLRCMFWFNPLLYFALHRFRLDQELACDEWVIARNPRARRQYGEAMLKTQFDELPLPLGCHWQTRHPIKERIDMLKRPTPSPMQWMAATFLALGLSASAGYAAWAAQPAQAPGAIEVAGQPGYAIDVRMDVDGNARAFQLRARAGQPFGMRSQDGRSPTWEATFTLKPLDDRQQVWIGGSILADGKPVSDPAMVVALGQVARIQVSTPDGGSVIDLELTVRRLDEAPVAAPTAAEPATDGPAQSPAAEGQVVEASPLSTTPAPKYPVEAARQGIGGEVVLLVTVDTDGSVRDAQVEKSTPPGVFDAATLEAARLWRFTPLLREGKPVQGQVRVPVTFELGPAYLGDPIMVDHSGASP